MGVGRARGGAMTCDQFCALIGDDVDGSFVAGQRGPFRAHQLRCRPCRRTLEAVRAVIRVCRRLPPLAPPAGVWARAVAIPILAPAGTCAQAAASASALRRGYLPPAAYRALRAHTAECPLCRAIAPSAPSASPDTGSVIALPSATRREHDKAPAWGRRLAARCSASVGILLAAAGLLWGSDLVRHETQVGRDASDVAARIACSVADATAGARRLGPRAYDLVEHVGRSHPHS